MKNIESIKKFLREKKEIEIFEADFKKGREEKDEEDRKECKLTDQEFSEKLESLTEKWLQKEDDKIKTSTPETQTSLSDEIARLQRKRDEKPVAGQQTEPENNKKKKIYKS